MRDDGSENVATPIVNVFGLGRGRLLSRCFGVCCGRLRRPESNPRHLGCVARVERPTQHAHPVWHARASLLR